VTTLPEPFDYLDEMDVSSLSVSDAVIANKKKLFIKKNCFCFLPKSRQPVVECQKVDKEKLPQGVVGG
jgi:hypothetical protein